MLPLRALGEQASCLLSFLVAPRNPCLQTQHSGPGLRHHAPFSMCACVSSPRPLGTLD